MKSALPDDRSILTTLEPFALAAGKRIMEICRLGFETLAKEDCSPVTQADRDAEAVILEGLRRHFPDIPVVAEEDVAEGGRAPEVSDMFFLVDPLDGTREFVAGKGDFTVNIALIRNGAPAAGVIYAPASRQFFAGCAGHAEMGNADEEHCLLERRSIRARPRATPPKIVASRSHNTPATERFIAGFPGAECVTVGSSLKFCLLASGQADLYPRLGRTMQWDTAAGDAILRGAGGMTTTLDGRPFVYGPGTAPDDEPYANPHFIAAGPVAAG